MSSLLSRTLLEHSKALQKKEYSSEELTVEYLKKVKETDTQINAYITLTEEEAVLNARESDKRRAKQETRGTLDGIPYAAKDNISTRGIKTTCGSKMLENYISPYDAHVIELLKANGAILLGKVNLDEFAMGISTETSYFGVTRNPIDSSHVAGGSSGGSAAAVCAHEAAFALGSDTGGSVRQPAAFCGVVGMRPTYGSISRYGLISFAPSFDQIGPITQNVYDNALVMNALCLRDARDESSLSHPCRDFTAEIGKSIKGMKIALLDIEYSNIENSVCEAMLDCAKILCDLGAQVERVKIDHSASAYASYYITSCAEASSNLARFDGVRYGYRAKSYSDIDEMYRNTRSQGFGEEAKRRILFGTMALSSEYCNDFYNSACNMRSVISSELSALLENYDAIMLPTAPCTAYTVGQATRIGFDACIDDIFCAFAALSGMPAISVPYQKGTDLPVGIQLMGKHFSEPTLYKLAVALEDSAQEGGSDGNV